MTISPPTKVKLPPDEPGRVLVSGIDTIVFSLDVQWKDGSTFEELADQKRSATDYNKDVPGLARLGDGTSPWIFQLKPFGSDGYEWILASGEMTLKIGRWLEPMSRPSVIAEIRSEALWMHGARVMLGRVVAILHTWGGEVVTDRISRVDLCVDVLLPDGIWHIGLLDQLVTRAQDVAPYLHCKQLNGIRVGKGQTVCRLYDKIQEIRQQSYKYWMFRVWGMGGVEDGFRVIRVEYQLRRESLKRLGVGDFKSLVCNLPELWAYCTQNWLKVQTGTGNHHTQRHTVPWWGVVQGGFSGALDAHPCIRDKAIKGDAGRLLASIVGYMSSYAALSLDGTLVRSDGPLSIRDYFSIVCGHVIASEYTDTDFTERVKKKQAMLTRSREKFTRATGALEPPIV